MGPKKEAGKGRAFESKSKSEVAGGAKCKPGESSAKKGSKNCAEEKAAVKKGNSKKGGKREAEDPAAKAAREAEEERALYPPSEDEDDAYCAQEEEEEEEEDETTSTAPVARTTDKFGNSVAGGECAKNAALERARCEARQRREAKAAAAAAATCARGEGDDAADRVVAPGGGCGSEKAATGKLSNKAKKLLKKEQERAARLGPEVEVVRDELESFSLSLSNNSSVCADEDEDLGNGPRQKDVVIEGFSISAPARPLLVNADLKLTAGRRYGLIGANGRGKSTLLKFLARRRLPHRVDALLVEQESSLGAGTVLESVLAADCESERLRRSALELEEALKTCEDEDSLSRLAEELKRVGSQLDAAGADAAEAKARSILAGLGFDECAMATRFLALDPAASPKPTF